MKKEAVDKSFGSICYLAGIFILLAGVSFFAPYFGFYSEAGQFVPLTSWKVIFGGSDAFNFGTYVIGLDYKTNIPLLIFIQVILFTSLSAFLSKNSPGSLMFSLILNAISIGGCGCSKWFFTLINKNAITGIRFGSGFYLMLALLVFAFVILLVSYIKSKAFWKARKAV